MFSRCKYVLLVLGFFVAGFLGGVCMKKSVLIQRRGKMCHVRLTPHDPMTASFSRAVSNAINTAKANGNPVARYDRVSGRSYMEYPDGKKVYDKTT